MTHDSNPFKPLRLNIGSNEQMLSNAEAAVERLAVAREQVKSHIAGIVISWHVGQYNKSESTLSYWEWATEYEISVRHPIFPFLESDKFWSERFRALCQEAFGEYEWRSDEIVNYMNQHFRTLSQTESGRAFRDIVAYVPKTKMSRQTAAIFVKKVGTTTPLEEDD